MLGGERDEVVPREHMHELWGIVQTRKYTAAAPEATSRTHPRMPGGAKTESAGGVQENGRTTQINDRDTYIEFANGTHSAYRIVSRCSF